MALLCQQPDRGLSLEELAHAVPVFHCWRLGKERPGQGPPLPEAFRLPKGDHVMLDTLPVHAQPVFAAIFFNPFQSHAEATIGSLEKWHRLRHRGFEILGPAGVNRQIGNFDKHGLAMAQRRERGKKCE